MASMDPSVLVFTHATKVNWDAALTLGTCIIVAGATISPLISKIYQRYKIKGKYLWNTLLGTILVSSLFLLTFCSVILLGYWTAQILQALGIEQGIIRPWTPQGLEPYRPFLAE